MYYRVFPFWRSFDSYGLVYQSDDVNVKAGSIYEIPYGKQHIFGIIFWEISLTTEQEWYQDDIKVLWKALSENIFLDSHNLELISFMAHAYFCPIHHALWLFFPKNLLEKIQKQTLHKVKIRDYNYSSSHISLSPKQEKVYQQIQHSSGGKFLLYGVTGSGKTQIYMKIIEDMLREGKQSLVLIPEIILTSQLARRIAEVFGDDVVVLHSWVSAAKKTQYWMDIQSGNAKIIVGTRSALFYPYSCLGCIIVDEEHDESYISENSPRYHATHIAQKIAEQRNVLLILASGTPKITTLYKTKAEDFRLLQLLEKYNDYD